MFVLCSSKSWITLSAFDCYCLCGVFFCGVILMTALASSWANVPPKQVHPETILQELHHCILVYVPPNTNVIGLKKQKQSRAFISPPQQQKNERWFQTFPECWHSTVEIGVAMRGYVFRNTYWRLYHCWFPFDLRMKGNERCEWCSGFFLKYFFFFTPLTTDQILKLSQPAGLVGPDPKPSFLADFWGGANNTGLSWQV